ncbi:V-type ATP synthase subunit D [Cecembia lonarensis]|uniref:V-type ATP synthase subunit D n=1 Tax=Cecembia lonarensis (strain CCUG 58316 / KCTC 22772 / LW9) TaxID=1225176 RepID=K1LI99_CECL9|nr:V-type ATP synthase subunit D [Cecembia lonarensis]EKB50003.1 V-type ATP synthase subunit D [Cecembia lonarensis LW9]
MALKFHYNKTTIQLFERQLAIRQKALPILKNKEMALRMVVVKLMGELEEISLQKEQLKVRKGYYKALWAEFPEILLMDKVETFSKKVIGVKVPEIKEITFKIADVSWWNLPAWVPGGIALMKEVITLNLKADILQQQIKILDLARKKTTQKVNLYEKVQIPEYEDAIMKIKRFLEDKENISKAAQKIVKKRKESKAV